MASSLLSGIGCTPAPCLQRRGVIKLSRWRLSTLGVCCQPCLAPFKRLLETLRRLTKPSPTVRNGASLGFCHEYCFSRSTQSQPLYPGIASCSSSRSTILKVLATCGCVQHLPKCVKECFEFAGTMMLSFFGVLSFVWLGIGISFSVRSRYCTHPG